jgi:VanZ family protein
MRHQRLARYGPLIVWAALIFIGSTNALSAAKTGSLLLWLLPHLSERKLKIVHLLVRKAGHVTEYAIFALLLARAFTTSSHQLLRKRWFGAVLLLVIAYALSDEFHQSFYPSRTASIYDCMIDSVGGLTALLIIWWRRHRLQTQTQRHR